MALTAAAAIAAIKTTIGTVSGVQSATVLRERILLIQDQVALLEKAISEAEAEIADQAQELEELNAEVSRYRETQQYAEHNGALFKRIPGGGDGYQEVPFCPKCRNSAGKSSDRMPFFCLPCNWFSSFDAGDIKAVMRGLPG